MATAGTIHEGHNIKRIREILGIKQDALAIDLGLTQQAVSLLEQKETLDAPMLDKVAKAMGVTVDAIKNFKDELAISITSSTLHDNSGSVFYNPNFNPLDKVVELYERLLKEKDVTIDELKKVIEGLKTK